MSPSLTAHQSTNNPEKQHNKLPSSKRITLLPCPSQVQNMTQAIQVQDQRTQRDLQYVERMELQLKGLETKFRQVEENHKQNMARQFKVGVLLDTSGL